MFYLGNLDSLQVVQGQLNNLYLTSAISTIAEYPELIKRLFLVDSHNPQGLYAIALCIQGLFKSYIVDDKFYYIEKYHTEEWKSEYNKKKQKKNKSESEYIKAEFIFSYSARDGVWISLLEKAYAKAYGCYWNIGTGGYGDEALMDLTGAPSENIRIEDFVPHEGYIGEKESIPDGDKANFKTSLPQKIENKFNALFRRIYFSLKFGYLLNASVKGSKFKDIGNGLRAGMR